MSEFWKYFRDTLAWPLIHTPGPLSSVVRGAALALDRVRDDVVFFRRQWFPALCEPELVADHGQSRGLVRHPKETPDQFRARVVNAYRWHLLGGKTEGLPEILNFYGFNTLTIENLRRYQPSRWAEFQVGLKTPATQEAQEALLADLDALIWLVNEYKPARSVLARLYTDIYNRVPTVWSEGPAWSEGFWSMFSGVPYPPPGDGDDGGLIVSFGMVYRAQSERYNESGAGLGVESRTGVLAPYIDRPVWSRSAWSEVFPKNHGFTIGELVSLHWCVRTTTSYAWRGGWDSRRWQEAATWDRILPPWRFRWNSWARAQAVFSWPGDGGEAGDPVSVHGDGTWGDINACYSLPTATGITNPAKWGDAWGHDPQRRDLTILERFRHKDGLVTPAVSPSVPQAAGIGCLAVGAAPLRNRGWAGGWNSRRWLADLCPLGIASVAAMVPHRDPPEAPCMAGHDTLAGEVEALAPQAPQVAGEENATVLGSPLHNQRWQGAPNARRWWDYVGQTNIRSEKA